MSAAARVDQTLAALADPHRRAVVELLRRGPKRAGELADALELSPPAMSRHLRQLRRRGLIEEGEGVEEDARVRRYQLRREPFRELAGWLEDVERFWQSELDAFAAHAERKHGKARK